MCELSSIVANHLLNSMKGHLCFKLLLDGEAWAVACRLLFATVSLAATEACALCLVL
jgi:hypothetical protein